MASLFADAGNHSVSFFVISVFSDFFKVSIETGFVFFALSNNTSHVFLRFSPVSFFNQEIV